MKVEKMLLRCVVAIAVVAGVVAPASATTLIRADLDDLAAANRTIVVGEVLDMHSYWNVEGTFILTDVRVAAIEVLKGKPRDAELTVTVMGGTVGELTTLIVGGAELVSGNSYVLFLNEEDLPGVRGSLTVRDHCQGVFEIVPAGDELRAVSQANSHPLVPDALGSTDVPGGSEGLELNTMMRSIRELVDVRDAKEVTP